MGVKVFLLTVFAFFGFTACTPSERPEAETRPEGASLQPAVTEIRSGVPDAIAPPGRSGSVLAPPGSIDGLVETPREIWRFSAGAPATASPVTAGDIVVAGFADFTFRGLDAADGTQLWLRETAAVPASIAVSSSGVFVADLATVSLLSIQDGNAGWTLPIGVSGGARILATSTAVYSPTPNGRLAAIAAETGDLLWTADLDPDSEAPAVGVFGALDGVLYACTADGGVAAVNAADGAHRWLAHLPEQLSAGPAVRADGVTVASVTGNIYSLHRDTGEWVQIGTVGEPVVSSVVVTDRSLFVFGAAGGVFRLDPGTPASGAPLAPTLRLGSDLAGQPALLDSVILVTDASGRLRGLEVATGVEMWATTIGPRLIGEMTFSGGTVFAAGAEGTVLALVFDVPLDSAPFLSGDRLWDLPSNGRFRMKSRFVEFRYLSEAGVVVEWSVHSSVPDDPLVLTILDAGGTVLATNMGKVVLDRSARAAVEAAGEIRIRVERSYPDRQAVLALVSEVVQ